MKSALAVFVLCAGSLFAACGDTGMPLQPSGTSTSVASNFSATPVPFKGDLDGEYGTPSGAFPIFHETISATGQATHLGRYRLDIAETVNLLQASATGTFTFTAANGDQLFGSFTGQAQPGPLVQIVETAAISGGTGRFANATGSFEIDRVFDPVARTTTGTFDGALSGS